MPPDRNGQTEMTRDRIGQTEKSCSVQTHVAELANGLFYCWSLLRNNNMAMNLQSSLQVTIVGRLSRVGVDHRQLWQVMQGDSDCWKHKTRGFILCEKKHQWICNKALTSLKNPFISVRLWVWCDQQCAWVNSLIKLIMSRLLFTQYKTRTLF